MFCENFENFYSSINKKDKNPRKLLILLMNIAKKIDINIDFYKSKIDSLTGKV